MKELTVHLVDHEFRLMTVEFQHLASVPAVVEWFANIDHSRARGA